jgi:cob(I)alamin adenosyltransferase
MGNRLSKIVTRTGDTGTTGLGDGSRVPKDTARIEAIGSVDELNSSIGLVGATPNLPADVANCLLRIQHDLFDLGGELAIPGHTMITDAQVAQLEADVDRFNATLPPLKEFILPGGGLAAAHCHLARTIARRAERRCWTLSRSEPLGEALRIYLNRLSDLLFVLARVLARHEQGSEVLWNRTRLV